MGAFIPKLADHTANLRELNKDDVEFDWCASHTQDFKAIKKLIKCSGGEIGDFEYDAGIDLGVVVAEDGCGGGIGCCSNGCSGGCEDDSDIFTLRWWQSQSK
ncbi:Hypothetical predicted protein [Octopus vulgaris]|uniref:Uncharacterized protein n=1 Tax=Octopus vulgaris TaxID=6645 RepID=A0AA36EYY5_OCTVU|nr:Hypothetical predicted protein [Octopus vulgaris]